MLIRIISVALVILLSAGCAQSKSKIADDEKNIGINKPLSEKCLEAKQDFDKAVQAGARDNLHELKRNIELYCVWRRY